MSLFSYAAAQGYIRARLSRLLDRETWARLLEANTAAELAQLLAQTAVTPAIGRDGQILLNILRGELADTGRTLARFLPRGTGELVAWNNQRFELTFYVYARR